MIADTDGLPLVKRSARGLGVRTPLEAGSNEPDVTVSVPEDTVQPKQGGMSTAPNDPKNLPPFRRPTTLGGRSKDPVWEIDSEYLGPNLQLRQDSPTHAIIEPARPMTLAEYEAALAATRDRWVIYSSKGTL